MYRYKRLLVGLTMDNKDNSLIQYAGMISRMAQSDEVHFVHFSDYLEIPQEVREQYPELLSSTDQMATETLKKDIEQKWQGFPSTRLSVRIDSGRILPQMLQIVRDQDVDLIILGKSSKNSALSLASKLARKAPCSVLVVPEEFPAQVTRLLTALDFSEHSRDAMDVSIAFANAAGLSQFDLLHAYRVPSGFFKTGKSYKEFAEIMQKNAENEYQRFMQLEDLKGLYASPHFWLNDTPFKSILQAITDLNPDLLVMGSRGRSAGAAVLLGSTTEKLIQTSPIPVLAAKKKGAGMGFVDALLNL